MSLASRFCSAFMIVFVGLMLIVSVARASDRAFSVRYSSNDTGNIAFAANTLMTCPSSDNSCDNVQDSGPRTTANSDYNNDSYDMQYVDVDSDSTTYDSSRAGLTLPAGAQVLFAGLYWSGDRSPNSSTLNTPAGSSRTTVKIKAPGASAYTTLTSDQTDDSDYDSHIYSSFKDVTSIVAAAGAGSYTVANVQAGTGQKGYAGWAMYVAYRDTSQPARNLTIIDGFKSIGPSDGPTNIPVSGFQTPPAGTVHSELGMLAWEGDLGIVGDTASLNGTTLSDAQHPATNYFDSKISRNGVLYTDKTPNYNTQMGMDLAFQNADGLLGNNATSATIRVTTSGDLYLPSAFSFTTELYAPKIDQVKTVTDLNGGNVEQGDTLEYRVSGTNNGQDGAVNFILRDPIPAGTTYVPGSINIVQSGQSGSTGVKTDGTGDDQAELDGANRVIARLGDGASSSAGGKIGIGKSYDVRFRVKVNGNPPTGTTIANTATSSFNSESLNTPLTAVSSASVIVKSVDLNVTKTRNGTIVPGANNTYDIVVKNVGEANSTGTVTMTDTLPSTLTPVTATGTGWACGIAAQTVTCTRSDALAPTASYPTITLTVHAAADAEGAIDNTATIGGGGDGNLANNTSTAPGTASPQIDLAMTKDTDHATVGIGDLITYTLVATNNGPSKATSVTVTDPLPAGLQYVSVTPSKGTCTGTATVSCAIGSLNPAETATVTIVVRATAAAAGTTVRNTASVAGAQPETNTTNNSDFADVYVAGSDLKVVKTASPANPVAGGPISWNITVDNLGPSTATSVNLRDVIPTQVQGTPTVTVVSGTATCAIASGELNCNLGTMLAGAQVKVRIDGTLKADLGTARIDNTATVSGAEPEVNTSNNTSTASSDVVSSADVQITKAASTNGIDAGDTVTYTLTAKNNGLSVANGVSISDPIPAGMTFVSADGGCTNGSGGTITCVIGTLAKDATAVRHIVLKAADSTTGVVQNTATVTATTPDSNPANNTDTAPVVVSPKADLAIVKSASPTAAIPGDNVTYTLVVTNNGPSTATGVSISDPLPSGVTFVSADSGCTFASGTITCTIGTLAKSATATKHFVVKVADATTGTVHNVATVSGTTPDPNPANDSDDADVTVTPSADVALAKSASPTAVSAGDNVTYTLVATNNGPSTATGVSISDPLPAGVTFVSADSGCALAGGTVTCTIGTLAKDASATKHFVVKIADATTGTVHNVGTVSSITPDTNPTNNTASADVTVAPKVDVALVKTASPTTATPGDNVTYTLVATNNGPSTANAVSIGDPLPSGVTFVSADSGCAFASGTVTCAIGTLAKDASATKHFVVKIANATTGTVHNVGTVSTTSPDSNPANDSDDADVTVTPKADVALVKTASPTTASPGDNVTYTLVATNNGPSTATGVSISDPLPSGVTFVSADSGCALASGTVTCTIGTLAKDATATKHFVVKIANATTGSVHNVGTVSATTPDPDHSNDSDDADVTVTPKVDVALVKTASPTSGSPGDNVTFTLAVTNNGPSTATGVSIADALPAGLTFVSADSGCTNASGTITCTVGTLAKDASATKHVTVKIAAGATGTIHNVATVTSTTPDTNPANNSDDADVAVTDDADLSIVKSSQATATPGENVEYTLLVHNHGPSAASGVKVTDAIPAGTTFVSASSGCANASGTVTCIIGGLANGAETTLHITVKVGASTVGIVHNVAVVSADTPDSNHANDSDDADFTVALADLSIDKSVLQTDAAQGDVVDYTLKIRNDGSGTAHNVVASDPLPAGLDFVSVDTGACAFAGGVLTCNLGDMAAGTEKLVHFKAKVTIGPSTAVDHQHFLPVSKVEQQVDLEAGQTRSIELSCPTGTIMTDGAIRFDSVDQATGTPGSLLVLRSRSKAGDAKTYEFTVKNTATGRIQTKAFGTCLADTTSVENGHTHAVIVGEPVTATVLGAPVGRTDVSVACGPGQVAVSPGYTSAGGTVRIVRTWPDGTGRGFTLDVSGAPADVTVSARCMNTKLAETNGHTHDVDLEFREKTIDVPAGQIIDTSVICGDQSKGIVSAWDMPDGLLPLGNDPQPKSRVFRIQNTTDHTITAKLGLLCIGDRTKGGAGNDKIVNSATVTSATPDVDSDDQADSANLHLIDAPAAPADDPAPSDTPAPADTPAPSDAHSSVSSVSSRTASRSTAAAPAVTATPAAPSAITAEVQKITVDRSGQLSVTVSCAKGCSGTLTIRATATIKIGGKTYKKGAKIASVKYKVKAGKKTAVKVKLSKALAKAAKAGKLKQVKVTLG